MRGLFKNYAREEIAFQDGVLFKELQIYFQNFKSLKKKDVEDSEINNAIEKCVKSHTGITIMFTPTEGEHSPAVAIPDINKNNVLVGSFVKNFLNNDDGRRMVANAEGLVRGSVNLRNSKVTGIFGEVGYKLYFPTEMLVEQKYTASECAAMMLHEIGHLFTYFEFISRTVTTNQVLAGIARTMEKTNDPAEREVVLMSAKKALKLSDLDVAKLSKSNDLKVVSTVVISSAIKEATSEIGSNIYDANNWEQLADQFAVRHGAGRDLHIALEKLMRSSGNISFRNTFEYFVMEAVKLIILVGSLVFVAVSGPAGILAAIGKLGIFTWLLLILIDLPGDGTYDRPGVRLKRIKNQLMECLKQPKLKEEEKKSIMEDIVLLEAQEEDVKDRLQLFSVLWGWISRSQRKRLEQEELQQELEDLASNTLFLKAEQLKQA